MVAAEQLHQRLATEYRNSAGVDVMLHHRKLSPEIHVATRTTAERLKIASTVLAST